MKEVVFVTGNQSKADILTKFIGLPIERQDIVLEEIQGTPEQIVDHKVRQAYAIIGKPALVEDVSLEFDALAGMPGPYIKHFLEDEDGNKLEDGPENLCRMLDGFVSRRATGRCVYGYFDGTETSFIKGEIHGTIAEHPRGTNGFGWNAIFEADGFGGKTQAEMVPSDDPVKFASVRPWAALRTFLTEE